MSQRRHLRVLVAERDEAARDAVGDALEAAGHRVVARCADAAAVIDAIAGRRIDVCLVGLDLPGGGVSTARAISARRSPPRIVLLASSARERDVFAGLRAGASAFLVRDVDASTLPSQVEAVFAGEALLPPGMTLRLIEELRSMSAGRRGCVPKPEERGSR
jgi:DNA-binding NarL/FixJ family response regulator